MSAFQALCIEVESVATALEAMRQAKPLGLAHPLNRFVSIHDPYNPSAAMQGAAAQDLKVSSALVRIIRHRLNEHREVYDLQPLTSHEHGILIDEDFQRENSELEAWSLLYYRYVRVELDLSLDKIGKRVGQTERTLHRRQTKGVHRLTETLARRELHARAHLQQSLLQARLPTPPPLVGRDQLLDMALSRLTRPDLPHRLLFYGPQGIGKTALASTLARLMTDQMWVKNVAWLDETSLAGCQPDHLLEQIALQLGVPLTLDSRLSLTTYLSIVDSLIILDQAQSLVDRPDYLQSLIAELGPARLILCAHFPPSVSLDVAYMKVPELDKTAAFELLEKQADNDDPLDEFEQLFSGLGGNPRALRLAFTVPASTSTISGQLYEETWQRASPSARCLWLALLLYTPETFDENILSRLLPESHDFGDSTAALAELKRLSVVASDVEHTGRIILVSLARMFAEWLLTAESEQELVHLVIRQVVNYLAENPEPKHCLRLLDLVQQAEFWSSLRLDLAYAFAPVIEQAGAWSTWHSYLESLHNMTVQEDKAWVALHQGIALRWLGRLPEAAHILLDSMQIAGQIGQFELQADAMIELGVVYRYLHDHHGAADLLRCAREFYQRYQLPVKLQRATAEEIELALETGDLAAVKEELNSIIQDEILSPRLLSLAARATLQNGDLDTALVFAQKAQQALINDLPNLARITALIGQIHSLRGEWGAAIDHMLWVLCTMEETNDVVGRARARLNLAIMYLDRGKVSTALSYLEGLPAELEALGDLESLQIAATYLEKFGKS